MSDQLSDNERIKVYGTKEGKLYIKPFDLFSMPRIQKLIKKVAKARITRNQ